jgi:hypothetical protein
MRRALGGKLKLDFVDGTFPVVVDRFDPSFRAWNRCNMLVHSWIMNSVSDSIAQSIVYMDNTLDVWNDLRERFSQADLVRISEIQQEVYALKQDSRSVTEFYSELKLLWEELEIYLPMPLCTCPQRCSCEAMRSARSNHTLLSIMRFLTGLNEQFSVVKSQILLMDPLPPMNKVFSLVLQHERQMTPIDDSKVLLNAAKGKAPYSSKPSSRTCTFCGRGNHTVDNCFQKHGLPPHLRKSTTAATSNNALIEGGIDDASISTESNNSNVITQEQAFQLISLLQNTFPSSTTLTASSDKVGSNQFSGHVSVNSGIISSSFNTCSLGNWIVDSGASHHICNSTHWFHSYKEIIPIRVKLPNGNYAIAKYSGIINFSSCFTISEVLCIPNFSVNLLSVSQLCKIPKYVLQFTNSQCTIQDIATQKMIGLAEELEGLYYLKLQDAEAHASVVDESGKTTIPSQAIWHFRLGHLSNPRLAVLHSKFPYITVDNKGICDVCHLAKHKKTPYKISLNKAVRPYEIIHVDIWGPLNTTSLNGYSYFLTVVDDYSRFT